MPEEAELDEPLLEVAELEEPLDAEANPLPLPVPEAELVPPALEEAFPVEALEAELVLARRPDEDAALPPALPALEDALELPLEDEPLALALLRMQTPRTQFQPLGQKPPAPHALPVTSTVAEGLQSARATTAKTASPHGRT